MNKSKSLGIWKAEDPAGTDTRPSSIRGKTISGPIPFPDDDEFSFRVQGSNVATTLETKDSEKERSTRVSELVESHSTPQEDKKDNFEDSNSIETAKTIPPHPARAPPPPPPTLPIVQPSYGTSPPPIPPPIFQPESIRLPTASITPHQGLERPKPKKSSFRSFLSKIFKNKRKDTLPPRQYQQRTSEIRVEQHRSVSLNILILAVIANESRILPH